MSLLAGTRTWRTTGPTFKAPGRQLQVRRSNSATPLTHTRSSRLRTDGSCLRLVPRRIRLTGRPPELRLAELVCAAAADTGWEVLLKLKPTGGQDDWIAFSERWPNVQISDEVDAPGPMDYFLDDDYNNRRLADLARVQFVVNSVTTFGLDAALAGVPVLQLSELSGPGLVGLKSAQRNYHIRKYLLSHDHTFRVAEDDIRSHLADWLRDPDDRAASYSKILRSWLLPSAGFDAAVDRAVERALEMTELP